MKPMMKAVFINEYGNKIQCKEIDTPTIEKPNQVLIKVMAVGLNPLDYKIRDGKVKLLLNYKFPIFLGNECSGIVTEVGKDVTKFKPGDEVFIRKDKDNLLGTFAEYFRDEEEYFAPKPQNLSHDEAASIPLAGLTAWQAIVEHAKVQKSEKVFIGAGAGGVGSLAIQIAKNIVGAEVITTSSKKDICQRLGADRVIDYHNEKFDEVLKDIDFCLDVTGEVSQCIKITKKNGKIITIGGVPSSADVEEIRKTMKTSWFVPVLLDTITWNSRRKAQKKNIEYFYMWMKGNGEQLNQLGKYLEEGKLVPLVDKVFPGLDKMGEALAHLESGHCTGKVVVHVGSEEQKN